MPLEELLSMYGYNFEECAPEVLNVDENTSDASNLPEASVPEGILNSNRGESNDHSSKTRSKFRYLRENHNYDSSMYM